MPAHIHTANCIGGNELNELTCAEIGRDALRNARCHTVVFLDGTETRVFTDTKDDAIALARVEEPSLEIVNVVRATAAEEHANMERAGLPGSLAATDGES